MIVIVNIVKLMKNFQLNFERLWRNIKNQDFNLKMNYKKSYSVLVSRVNNYNNYFNNDYSNLFKKWILQIKNNNKTILSRTKDDAEPILDLNWEISFFLVYQVER